jgi:hypothetical protein
MTHDQMMYLAAVIAAFLIFSGSLLGATVSTRATSGRPNPNEDNRDHRLD